MVGSIETSSATWTRGLFEGRTTDMLLDTGSAVTILRAEVWNELKCVTGICELQNVSQSVVTADGSSLELLGQVTLLISVAIGGLVRLHPILVARNLTQECILGANFLVAHGCAIDYSTKTLHAGDKLVPIHCKALQVSSCIPVVCNAVLMENMCIQEQCEMQVPVSLHAWVSAVHSNFVVCWNQNPCSWNGMGLLWPTLCHAIRMVSQ